MSTKIASSTVEGVANIDLIKAEICQEICGENIGEISVDSLSVNIYGRQRSSLKVECANINTKNFILKRARVRKPRGIYVSEFLTSNKLKIYHQLYNLRRQCPHKFKAIFTRGGEVFCRTDPDDRMLKFNSLDDVEALGREIIDTSPPPPPPPPPPPAAADDDGATG